MASGLFIVFAVLCLVLLGAVLVRPARIYEYPYFMGIGFATFTLPQVYAATFNPGFVAEEGLVSLLLMCILCLGACWGGYQLPAGALSGAWLRSSLEPGRLFQAGLLFTVVGSLFSYLLVELHEDLKGTMWTGLATIYHFFSSLIYLGFAICLFLALRRPTAATVGATLLATVVPLLQAVLYARREPTALFLLTIGLGLYFQRGLAPSRLLVSLAIGFTLVFLPLTGLYRSVAQSGEWAELADFDYSAFFTNYARDARPPEMRLATRVIRYAQYQGDYRYGAGYWDQVVQRYVPAQLVGREFKESLLLGYDANYEDWYFDRDQREIPLGTTHTGMADAFREFGFLGCCFFGCLAYLFKTLWTGADEQRSFAARLFYTQNITVAIRSITHQTVDFVPGLIFNAVFLGLVLWYARSEETVRPLLARRAMN